jgi:hypothetical protein
LIGDPLSQIIEAGTSPDSVHCVGNEADGPDPLAPKIGRNAMVRSMPANGLGGLTRGQPVFLLYTPLYANFGCFALLTARKLQIFKLFESEALTPSEAANRLGIAHRPMEILLANLAAHRFLVKTGDRYSSIARLRAVVSWGAPKDLAETTYFAGLRRLAMPEE